MDSQTIVAESFSIPKQQFFDQPVTQLTNDGVHYIRAPLAARGTATCSCAQTCQISLWDAPQIEAMESGAEAMKQDYNIDEHIIFWLGFSTACGPFNQIAIYKYSQKLWDTSIYAREQAIIASNSFTDQCTANSVTVSPPESIIQGKRHSGKFIDILVPQISVAGSFNYLIPYDIVFSGVMDLNQLNPIFNSFPVGQLRPVSNEFYERTLYNATDDSFMRGNVKLTPLTHYLCDGIVRIIFDDNPDPQVLSLEVIGEIGEYAIRSG
ncbi:MAG: hypothetical protein EZS28_022395 [Streblomastix strix]|uniref:Uncharacterized protein n=1 Tax=Streblomastix strix TaxID=222440 RepID=A0A5J4VHU7_9EUKA|nr:MAG: hypothetical protein EZS28_022395 [Streblomastix strix]